MFICSLCYSRIDTNKNVYKAYDKNFCSLDCRENYCYNNSLYSNSDDMHYLQQNRVNTTNQNNDHALVIDIVGYAEKNIHLTESENWNIRYINCDIIKSTLILYFNTYISYVH